MACEEIVQRDFLPLEEWVFYKIYCGNATSEKILTNRILPLLVKMKSENLISSWFFIRYQDPYYHIRIRLKIPENVDVSKIFLPFSKEMRILKDQQLIWKIQIDTYEREIERYGKKSIPLVEQIFYHDSLMILKAIEIFQSMNEKIRWLFALKIIHEHLRIFQYDLTERLHLLNIMKESLVREFDISKKEKKRMADKFRQNMNSIMNLLEEKNLDENSNLLLHFIRDKNREIKGCVDQIIKNKETGILGVDFDNFNASLIHMSMNRLFISENRLHELVCYDFMGKCYKSFLAINKYN